MDRGHYDIRALRRLGLLRHLSLAVPHYVGKRKFRIPVLGGDNEGLAYTRPTFKTEILKLLDRISPVRQFVDVGANTGATLLEVCAFANDREPIRYCGFEPNPNAFAALEKLVELSEIQASLFPVGCGEKYELLPIFRNDASDSGATVVSDLRPGAYRAPSGFVALAAFDDLADKMSLDENFVFKIDVEGSELAVLKGARESIRNKRPFILCEVLHAHSPETLERNREVKAAIQTFLEAERYAVYSIHLSGEQLQDIRRIDEFPIRLYRDDPEGCDFIFIPQECLLAWEKEIAKI
jgi:FkbM family methyltransferase